MKRQRRLETFFQAQREAFTFFYIDWTRKPYDAVWLSEKPVQCQFQEEVQWREMKLFVTLGAALPANYSAIDLPQKSEDATLLSLVKSNLQKCVRRQLREKALQTARLFMMLDFGHFLRRLFIIMLEDVRLHHSMPVIVWLTAATNKGFRVSEEILGWLLSLVEWLCEESTETYYSQSISNDVSQLSEERNRRFYKEALEHPLRDALLSLLFRKSYGGMPGDMAMIMSFTSLLLNAEEEKHISSSTLREILYNDIPVLPLENIELSSADFHCYPQLILVIARENRDLSEKNIKAAIWHHSSKINHRVKTYPQRQDANLIRILWSRIQRRVFSLQKTHILTCRNKSTYQEFCRMLGK
jgi:hypothetical protein